MRADMHEVLIERPRHGYRLKSHRGNKPRVAEWDGEDGFSRDYTPRQNRTKYLSDLLSPLKRWLRAQVNRPWDKVWSELCAGIDTRGVIGRHLMDHARQFVDTDCRIDAQRRVWVSASRYHRQFYGEGLMAPEGLYVHPLTGLLRWKEPPPRSSWRRVEVNEDVRRLGENAFLLRRDGIWYAVVAERILYERKGEPAADFIVGGMGYRVTQKRQLSGSQLRRHGLENSIQ
jgi:hypothetical protein